MQPKRLFLAVKLQETEVLKAHKIQQEWGRILKLPQTTFVPKENFHMTLHFLGSVEEEKSSAIRKKIKKYESLTQFSCDLNRPLGFPSADRPRVLVMAGQIGNSPLSFLHSRIQNELNELKHPIEQRLFIPHITLFRLKEETINLNDLPQFSFNLQVIEFALFESQTVAGRVRYKILENWKLQ